MSYNVSPTLKTKNRAINFNSWPSSSFFIFSSSHVFRDHAPSIDLSNSSDDGPRPSCVNLNVAGVRICTPHSPSRPPEGSVAQGGSSPPRGSWSAGTIGIGGNPGWLGCRRWPGEILSSACGIRGCVCHDHHLLSLRPLPRRESSRILLSCPIHSPSDLSVEIIAHLLLSSSSAVLASTKRGNKKRRSGGCGGATVVLNRNIDGVPLVRLRLRCSIVWYAKRPWSKNNYGHFIHGGRQKTAERISRQQQQLGFSRTANRIRRSYHLVLRERNLSVS